MTAPLSPYMKRSLNKDKGVPGRKAESSLAKRLGGALRPGSGALAGAKGDVTVDNFLIENKSTLSESFSVKLDHLLKIYAEALETGKDPALAFQFVNFQGKSEKRMRWVMVPEAVFFEMVKDVQR